MIPMPRIFCLAALKSRPDFMRTERVSRSGETGVKRERLSVEGTVQGVGFRPFVYRLAGELGLTGYVRNTPAGATIEIEGAPSCIEDFKKTLLERKPPQARVLRLDTTALTAQGGQAFVIQSSEAGKETTALMLPDLAVCKDCLREMNDPADRRYRYPFINCCHCGPRFSIITALPYDRLNTTMAGFGMCKACRNEYEDPENRRHHAQPIACPACGPRLELRNAQGDTTAWDDEALLAAAQTVRKGGIVALKGIGGFHLVCDARSHQVVAELRRRKHRPLKPFAVMYPSLPSIRTDCVILPEEEALLTSAAAPIVLLRKTAKPSVADNVAPGNANLGVMLASTPLHHLLMAELGFPVIATSGNRIDEPVCTDEGEAIDTLGGIADVFLVHDRPIVGRCDDSIVRLMRGRPTLLRRARGYAPLPVVVNHRFKSPVLGVGGHLKNTVALAVGERVFLSPHIGNLDTPAASAAHRQAVEFLCRLYNAKPGTIVHDLHPDYRSTRLADKLGGDTLAVQHHYAHALACMAENGVESPCLAVTWDGAGFGVDHCTWGGEFLRIKPGGFERALHFLSFPLPGGDAAALDPKRAALGMLYAMDGERAFERDIGLPEQSAGLMKTALRNNLNCPKTSSAGRIFDAVAALTGIGGENSFEGQAAMALEFAAEREFTAVYDFEVRDGVIDWRPMLRGMLADLDACLGAGKMAGKFHRTLAAIIVAAAQAIGEEVVLLTGGCFQNALLLDCAAEGLERAGFSVYTHAQVPPNDGGLALGQVMAAAQAP